MTVYDWQLEERRYGISRIRPFMIFLQCSLFIIGVLSWIDATREGVGFMVSTWGQFAYSLPAEFWAVGNMGASALLIIGLIRPTTFWMVSLGAALHCVHFGLLAYSCIMTGGDPIVGIHASIVFLPLHVWLFVESLKDGYIGS